MKTNSPLPLLCLVLTLCVASSATAQVRTATGRSRMELAFDHGVGFGTEDMYFELAGDLRVYSPFGLGVVLRAGAATQIMSIAFAAEVGVAYRLDLLTTDRAGIQLGIALGPSVAYGPFDRGSVPAIGGWGMLHLDVWHRNIFVGIGVTGHALAPQGEQRVYPILTITPTLRVGGDWGL
jgi:hypothetical protein